MLRKDGLSSIFLWSLYSLLLLPWSSGLAQDVLDLAAEYQQVQKKVHQFEAKKRELLAQIYEIEKENNELVLEKSKITEKKLKLDIKLNQISRKIISLQADIEKQLPDLIDRFRLMDQVNHLPWIYSFLTAQSLIDLNETLETAKHINEQQGASVTKFIKMIENLEEQKKELRKVAHSIVASQKQIKNKEKHIGHNQKAKKRLLSKMEFRLKRRRKSLEKVEAKGKRLLKNSSFKNLEMLFGSSFFDQKGQLPPPIKRQVSFPYGLNKGLLADSIQLMQKGHFYSSPEARLVRSVAHGKVSFSGKLPGLGQVVVIDHGSRYYTTYGNLLHLHVKKNQMIKKNQILGKTGFKHLQWGTGLYFEIRHFSQPQNPDQWLKKTLSSPVAQISQKVFVRNSGVAMDQELEERQGAQALKEYFLRGKISLKSAKEFL